MFEYFEALKFGEEINAHGEKWHSVKILQNHYHLAVRVDDTMPALCYVVQEDEAPKKGGDHVPKR